MRSTLTYVVLAALMGLLLPMGVADDANSQSVIPIFGDECVATVDLGTVFRIVPCDLREELEEETGQVATVGSMASQMSSIPPCNGTNAVRFDGCYAAGNVAVDIENKGYDTVNQMVSSLPGVDDAWKHTD